MEKQRNNTGNSEHIVDVSPREYLIRMFEQAANLTASDAIRAIAGALPELARYLDEDFPQIGSITVRHSLRLYCDKVDWSQIDRAAVVDLVTQLNAFDQSGRKCIERIGVAGDTLDRNAGSLAGMIVTHCIPGDVIREAYADSQDARLALGGVFESAFLVYPWSLTLPKLALKVYGSGGAIRQLSKGENPVIDRVYESEHMRAAFEADTFELELTPRRNFKSLSKYGDYLGARIADVLEHGIGLSEEMSKSAASTIALSQVNKVRYTADHRQLDWGVIVNNIRELCTTLSSVGGEAIEAINQEFGIIDPRKYSESDLEALRILLDDTDERRQFIEYLNQGDVTAIFSDTLNDYSGAFRNTFSTYRSPDGRSLTFEVAEPEDLHRIMMKLRKLGIKPSCVVIAAHGAKCGMNFGKTGENSETGRSNHAQVATSKDGLTVGIQDIPNARIKVLVKKSMQPGKESGRRTIILNTCEGDAVTYNQQGDVTTETPSVASTLVETIGREDTDVFASPAPMAVDTSPDGGVIFLTKAKDESYEESMVKLTAEVIKSEREDVPDDIIVHREKVPYVYKA